MALKPSTISATRIDLPKGGGAIQGIGETFQADEFTGTASLSIPIPTSRCRGFEPRLSVDYSSGSGQGLLGLGFCLSIPSIAWKTSTGLPRYDGADSFLLSSAEDLVPIDGGERIEPPYRVVTYRPRLEGLFARIEQRTDLHTRTSHWRVISADNITSLFGTTENACISDPIRTRLALATSCVGASPRQPARRNPRTPLQRPKYLLNGLFTNDNVCWSMPARLRLKWWHRAYRDR